MAKPLQEFTRFIWWTHTANLEEILLHCSLERYTSTYEVVNVTKQDRFLIRILYLYVQ